MDTVQNEITAPTGHTGIPDIHFQNRLPRSDRKPRKQKITRDGHRAKRSHCTRRASWLTCHPFSERTAPRRSGEACYSAASGLDWGNLNAYLDKVREPLTGLSGLSRHVLGRAFYEAYSDVAVRVQRPVPDSERRDFSHPRQSYLAVSLNRSSPGILRRIETVSPENALPALPGTPVPRPWRQTLTLRLQIYAWGISFVRRFPETRC